METISAVVFIGTSIIAVTQFIKFLAPNVNGAWTILIAAGLGLLVSVIDTSIGVENVNIANGIMIGLSASGVVTVARNFSKPNVVTTTGE